MQNLNTYADSVFPDQFFVTSAATPLCQLLEEWVPSSYPLRLVKNEQGLIDGIVDMRYIQRLLSADNQVERVRWQDVNVGAIAETIFAVPDSHSNDRRSGSTTTSSSTQSEVVVPIYDEAGCVALVSNGETFVSWSRISAAMRQHQFDPVTHLPTRMAFNQRIREEMNRAARNRQALALLMVDLDYFKEINDQFGHSAGDLTLRMVADCLCASVRSYDFVGRYGGDEFTIICYGCRSQDITLPVMRLQSSIAALPKVAEHAQQVSLSIGVALLDSIDTCCSSEVIVENADACLYEAKRAGRSTAFSVKLDPFGKPLAPPIEIGQKKKR